MKINAQTIYCEQNHFKWTALLHFEMGEGVRDFDPPYASRPS